MDAKGSRMCNSARHYMDQHPTFSRVMAKFNINMPIFKE